MSGETDAAGPSHRATAICAAALVVLALGLRAWAFDLYAIHHPDELFQYLEPAHRLVFGYGLTPWEYRYGMRSWLPPLALSGPMRLGAWLDPHAQADIWLPRLAAAGFALPPLWAAYALGARRSRWHGLAGLFVAAVWCEHVYFSVHVLTEVMAAAAFLTAAALASDDARPRRLAAAGALLGLTAVMRFHYAPALAVFAALSCGRDWRGRWAPLALGGLGALTACALVDVGMGQVPFGWVAENVRRNILDNRAAAFGTSPPYAFALFLMLAWGVALAPILLLSLLTARRYAPLFWAAWTAIATHSLIGHKEYRFIWLAVATLTILAAIGTVDLLQAVAARRGWSRATVRAAFAAALATWAGLSAAQAASPYMRGQWRAYDPELRLTAEVGRWSPLCGVGLDGLIPWHTGGMTYLQRPVPWYLTNWRDQERMAPGEIGRAARGFNAALARQSRAAELPPAFRRVRCLPPSGGADELDEPVCLYERPGGCDPHADDRWRVEAVLLRHDS